MLKPQPYPDRTPTLRLDKEQLCSAMIVTVMLSARRIRFVHEYCVDWNATQAAIRAGYSENCARQTGSELLSNADIVAAINERKEELAAAAGLTREWVLRQWKQLAEADPNELTQVRRESCRFCHGVEHHWQWTDEAEFLRALADYEAKMSDSRRARFAVAPDGLGGFGYDPNKEPAPDCPQCLGEGVENVYVADTRRVKGAAKKLFAGVKRTKDGLEVKMRDQDAALRNISQYFGMIVNKNELSGPGGGPVAVAVSAVDLTDDQLAAVVAQGSIQQA